MDRLDIDRRNSSTRRIPPYMLYRTTRFSRARDIILFRDASSAGVVGSASTVLHGHYNIIIIRNRRRRTRTTA